MNIIAPDTPSQNANGDAPVFVIEAADTDAVVVPGEDFIQTAEYARSGPDLLLTGADGKTVLIHDYFSLESPPDLTDVKGAVIPADLAARLAGPQAPGQYAQAAQTTPAAAPETIGHVDNLQGEVTATRLDGTKVTLSVGDPIYKGDIIESGGKGGLGVVLADQSSFSMAENGRIVMDEMIYDSGTKEGQLSMSILHGAFTFISGDIAKSDPDAMVVKTPVATIGIRGTQTGIKYMFGTEVVNGQLLFVVLMVEEDGFIGEVFVWNQHGATVLNLPNIGTTVQGGTVPPDDYVELTEEQIIQAFQGSLSYMPGNNNANTYGVDPADTAALEEFITAAGGEGNDPIGDPPLPTGPPPPLTTPPPPSPTPPPLPTPTPNPTTTPDQSPDPTTTPDPTPPPEATCEDKIVFLPDDLELSVDLDIEAPVDPLSTVIVDTLPDPLSGIIVIRDENTGVETPVAVGPLPIDQLTNLAFLVADVGATVSSTFSYTVTDPGGGIETKVIDVTVHDVDSSVPPLIFGGACNDLLGGGKSNDTIIGFAGDDILYGHKGDDTLLGGPGNDTAVFDGGDIGTVLTVDLAVAGSFDTATTLYGSASATSFDTLVSIENIILFQDEIDENPSGDSASATISHNYFHLTGDEFANTIDVSAQATARAEEDAGAYIGSNTWDIHAGEGDNEVDVELHATASAIVRWSSASAAATVSYNTLNITAGGGDDTIHVHMDARAVASVIDYSSSADAVGDNNHNTVTIGAGNGENNIDLDLHAFAAAYVYSSDYTYASATADVHGNTVKLTGGSDLDTINLRMAATASATHSGSSAAYADVDLSSNTVTIDAKNGYNKIDVDLEAYAIGSAYDDFASADAEIVGGVLNITGGDDGNLINLDMAVGAAAFAGGYTASADANLGESSSSNTINISGGNGDDTIDVDMRAMALAVSSQSYAIADANLSYNALTINGLGDGADTVSADMIAGGLALAVSGFSRDMVDLETFFAGPDFSKSDDFSISESSTSAAFLISPSFTPSYEAITVLDVENNVLTIDAGGGDGLKNFTARMGAVGLALGGEAANMYADIKHNTINITGGDAGNTIDVMLGALGFAAATDSYASATVDVTSSNAVNISGGAGVDDIYVGMGALAVAGALQTSDEEDIADDDDDSFNAYAHADLTGNTIDIKNLGAGLDLVRVDLGAYASASVSVTSSNEARVDAYLSYNDLTIDASGSDYKDVDIHMDAHGDAEGFNAYANVGLNSNILSVTGGDSGNLIDIDLEAFAHATASTSASNSSNASATANIFGNNLDVYGGNGIDDIYVNLTASASVQASTTYSIAMVNNNTLKIYGGVGGDTIDVTFKATAGGSSSTVSDNDAYISGGADDDIITVNLSADSVANNDVVLFGGADMDTFNLTNANTQVVLYYENVSELGATADLVKGLASGADITFRFYTGATGADIDSDFINAPLDISGIWGYDAAAMTLWYDADGGEGAGSTIDVAQFSTDVNVTLQFTAADWSAQVV